jgi:hypothetical protein
VIPSPLTFGWGENPKPPALGTSQSLIYIHILITLALEDYGADSRKLYTSNKGSMILTH